MQIGMWAEVEMVLLHPVLGVQHLSQRSRSLPNTIYGSTKHSVHLERKARCTVHTAAHAKLQINACQNEPNPYDASLVPSCGLKSHETHITLVGVTRGFYMQNCSCHGTDYRGIADKAGI